MDAYSPTRSNTSTAKTFSWLIRRELWEHRAFWVVPSVVMGIILLAHIVGLFKGASHLSIAGERLPAITEFSESMAPLVSDGVMLALVMVFGIAIGIVSVFYLLDSLYSDRRDRSVLFWKSLPITDTTTVTSKLFTGVVVLPLIALAAAFVTYLCILLLLTIAFGFREGFPLGLWNPVLILGSIGQWLVLTLTLQVWLLPLYAWLLFCSAFARKAPILVAVLVPLGIGLAEQLAYQRSYFEEIIDSYFLGFFMVIKEGLEDTGFTGVDFATGQPTSGAEGIPLIDITQFFTQPKLYAGLAVAAGFIYVTIYWRKNYVELG